MAVMIKLKLPQSLASFAAVKALPGLSDMSLDERFGLVPIDPRQSLYVVRTDRVDDVERRRRLSPEIQGAYGDTRISPV